MTVARTIGTRIRACKTVPPSMPGLGVPPVPDVPVSPVEVFE